MMVPNGAQIMKTSIKLSSLTALIVGMLILSISLPAYAVDTVTPIPTQTNAKPVPFFIGQAAVENPILPEPRSIPRNPGMAEGSWGTYHHDTYQSDTYFISGPLGHNPIVTSVLLGHAVVPITFFKDGLIVAGSLHYGDGGAGWWQLNLIDPVTLSTLDQFPLPVDILEGTFYPLGAYWYVDNEDRIVVATTEQSIWLVSHTGNAFNQSPLKYDLKGEINGDDDIRYLAPDFGGLIWFITRKGIVGTLNKEAEPGNRVQTTLLPAGAVYDNGIAIDEDGGIYFNSSKAMYRYDADQNGVPVQTWVEPYDGGTHVKVISRGSGTTPTLMGTDYVTIVDNADPQMHVLVYRRAKDVQGNRLVCAVPVFQPGQSATENSLIATDKSIIVGNNAGYGVDPKEVEHGRTTKPGFTRIDIDEDGYGCHIVWTNQEIGPIAAPKLSVKNGLIYSVTKDKGPANTDAWYFTAMDFYTGETVYKVLTGPGPLYNTWVDCLYIGPNGRAYWGVKSGIVSVYDGP